jgi:hypothetical protein
MKKLFVRDGNFGGHRVVKFCMNIIESQEKEWKRNFAVWGKELD